MAADLARAGGRRSGLLGGRLAERGGSGRRRRLFLDLLLAEGVADERKTLAAAMRTASGS